MSYHLSATTAPLSLAVISYLFLFPPLSLSSLFLDIFLSLSSLSFPSLISFPPSISIPSLFPSISLFSFSFSHSFSVSLSIYSLALVSQDIFQTFYFSVSDPTFCSILGLFNILVIIVIYLCKLLISINYRIILAQVTGNWLIRRSAKRHGLQCIQDPNTVRNQLVTGFLRIEVFQELNDNNYVRSCYTGLNNITN